MTKYKRNILRLVKEVAFRPARRHMDRMVKAAAAERCANTNMAATVKAKYQLVL